MAWGPKGKIIYSESKTVTLFGKEYHLKVTRVQKKTILIKGKCFG